MFHHLQIVLAALRTFSGVPLRGLLSCLWWGKTPRFWPDPANHWQETWLKMWHLWVSEHVLFLHMYIYIYTYILNVQMLQWFQLIPFFPKNTLATGLLALGVKVLRQAGCSIEISMCISSAQARTKWVSRWFPYKTAFAWCPCALRACAGSYKTRHLVQKSCQYTF